MYVCGTNQLQKAVQYVFNGHMKAWIASSANDGGQVTAIFIFRPFWTMSAKMETQRDAKVPISLQRIKWHAWLSKEWGVGMIFLDGTDLQCLRWGELVSVLPICKAGLESRP